jgi:hypothetical protein
MRALLKPRLRRGRSEGPGGRVWSGWFCEGGGFTGFGASPVAAFVMWRREWHQAELRKARSVSGGPWLMVP